MALKAIRRSLGLFRNEWRSNREGKTWDGAEPRCSTLHHFAVEISLERFDEALAYLTEKGLRPNTQIHPWIGWRSIYESDTQTVILWSLFVSTKPRSTHKSRMTQRVITVLILAATPQAGAPSRYCGSPSLSVSHACLLEIQMCSVGWKSSGISKLPHVKPITPALARSVNNEVPQTVQKPRTRTGEELRRPSAPVIVTAFKGISTRALNAAPSDR